MPFAVVLQVNETRSLLYKRSLGHLRGLIKIINLVHISLHIREKILISNI